MMDNASKFKKPLEVSKKRSPPPPPPHPLMMAHYSPQTVYILIEARHRKQLKSFQLNCGRVCVGTYECPKENSDARIKIKVTELGMTCALPHFTNPKNLVNVCIPIVQLLEVKVCYGQRGVLIWLGTGPLHAAYMRRNLGLTGNHDDATVPYYCPLIGLFSQKWILIRADPILESDKDFFKTVFKDVLFFNELSLEQCINFCRRTRSRKEDLDSLFSVEK